MTAGSVGSVAVLGAASQIGTRVTQLLQEAGIDCSAIDRGGALTTIYARQPSAPAAQVDAIVTLAPLPTVENAIAAAQKFKARRLIAFGSTGVLFKGRSPSALDRDFVAQQEAAEERMAGRCAAAGIAWTLFRPTMVYGAAADLTVTTIGRLVQRCRFYPIPFDANGLRQPVHVDDLAQACVRALDAPAALDRSYNLGGGEVLPYREMVARIFVALGLRPRLVPVPEPAFRLVFGLLRCLPRFRYFDAAMVSRLRMDMTVDSSAAQRDFGYAARAFQPTRREIFPGAAPVTAGPKDASR